MSVTKFAAVLSVLLGTGLVGAAVLGPDGLVRHEQLRNELGRVRAANDDLRTENRRLSVERKALRHDEAYIESVIRDDLGYIRADEVVLEFPDASR